MKDPIVDKVRAYRQEHAQQHGGDIAKIGAALRKMKRTGGYNVVRLPAKRLSFRSDTNQTPAKHQ